MTLHSVPMPDVTIEEVTHYGATFERRTVTLPGDYDWTDVRDMAAACVFPYALTEDTARAMAASLRADGLAERGWTIYRVTA